MVGRLIAGWVQGTGLAGLLLLGLTPVLAADWSPAVLAAWLCLPVYMIHQFEEHDDGRFARFVNQRFGRGGEVLGAEAIFLVNVPVVWGSTAAGFAWAASGREDMALLGIYLVLVNGLIHVGQAVGLRASNPGLITAVVLFLPLGVHGLTVVEADLATHLSALILVIVLHGVIVLHALGRIDAGAGDGG